MPIRARTLLLASLAAVPCLALAHNGRDGAPPPLDKWSRGMAQAKQQPQASQNDSQVGKFIDIYQGIVVKVDPKTGVRSYVQVGDVPANPARARVSVDATNGPGVDYWVKKDLERHQVSAPAETSYAYEEPAPQIAAYDEGYYGGYIPYGYGGYGYGDGGRPGGGHGGGGGRPGHGGGDDNPPPRTGWGINPQPYRPSPPPGPYGGGVGSPPPYNFGGVGAPPPELRYNSGVHSRRG
jgi:hypothetical protein